MPHSRCPFYFEHSKKRAGDSKAKALAYCEHKHSPVRRADVFASQDSALKCGGQFSKCQVPAKWRLDV